MLRLVVALMAGLLLPCGSRATETIVIHPCGMTDATLLPVASECVAAAIAESAFQEATHHRYKTYLITAIEAEHTPSTWEFLIILGDKNNPPPPGGHFMVSVDRATGKTRVTPGA